MGGDGRNFLFITENIIIRRNPSLRGYKSMKKMGCARCELENDAQKIICSLHPSYKFDRLTARTIRSGY